MANNTEVQAIQTAYENYNKHNNTENKDVLESAISNITNEEYTTLSPEEKKAVDDAKNMIEQIKTNEIQTNTDLTKAKTDIIGTFSSFENAKNATDRTTLKNTENYITDIQKYILATGASNLPAENLKDNNNNGIDDRLEDNMIGPITKAGVMTIQQYLIDTYPDTITRESLGCKNSGPDGYPGPKTLATLLEKDGEKTRYELIIEKYKEKNNSIFSKIYSPEDVASVANKQAEGTNKNKDTTKENNSNNKSTTEISSEELERKKGKLLEQIKKRPGGESITDLSILGITFNEKGTTQFPEGITWKYPDDNSNYEVLLKDGYIITNGQLTTTTVKNNKEITKENPKENTSPLGSETFKNYKENIIPAIIKDKKVSISTLSEDNKNPFISLRWTEYTTKTDINLHNYIDNTGKFDNEKCKEDITKLYEQQKNTNKYSKTLDTEIGKIIDKQFDRNKIFPDGGYPKNSVHKDAYDTFFNKFSDKTKVTMSSSYYIYFTDKTKKKVTLSIDFKDVGDKEYTENYKINTSAIFDTNGKLNDNNLYKELAKYITSIVENKDNGYI